MLPTGSRVGPGNTAGRVQAEAAGGPEPSWLRCCSFLLGPRSPLEVVQGSARWKRRAGLQSSVRFTPGPSVQLCLFSFSVSSLPTLNTILPWIHYRSSLCDAFLGGVSLHPKGSPELGLTPPLLWRSLTRYPPNFRTKCLLSQLPPPLEEFCCIRKIWRSHINALLLLKVLITLKASFAPVW